jgi:formate/nitrite transporter FocA (FNT family)
MNEIKKSIYAGGMISLGGFCYLTTLSKTQNSFLASITFFLGLSLIMLTKQSLFTGQILTKAHSPLREYIKTLSITWIFNFIGSIITTVLLSQILHPDITQLVTNKLSLNPIQIIISGLFCNALVCGAVATYNGTKNFMMSGFYITCFVLMSLEHSIANMTYMTLGLLQGINMNIVSVIVLMVCSTIGNIFGGRIIVNIINNREVKENEKGNCKSI